MARRWGLPAGLGWGGTKAKRPDAQAAYENTLGLMLEMVAGADFCFGAGLLDSVSQMSLEELVIADEVFGMVTRLLRGVTVDRETLAVDLIKKMGFNGDYLFDDHTRAHVRELWQAQPRRDRHLSRAGRARAARVWKTRRGPSPTASSPPPRPSSPRSSGASSTTSSPRSSPAASERSHPWPTQTSATSASASSSTCSRRTTCGRSTRRRSTSSRTCGVKFHSQNALDILEAHGATVDRETTVAKIPGRTSSRRR